MQPVSQVKVSLDTQVDHKTSHFLSGRHVVFVVNDSAFLLSHRINLVRVVRDAGGVVSVVCPAGAGCAPLRREGINVVNIRLSRWGANPIEEFGTVLDLVKAYRLLRPDVVHHVTIKAVLYGSIAARWANVPSIVNAVTGRGLVYSSRGILAILRRRLVNLGYWYALRNAKQRMIFQHEGDLTYFLKRRLVNQKDAKVIPGAGVDGDYYHPAPEKISPIKILFAARLLREKGVLQFVSLARKIKAYNKDVQFLVAGDFVKAHPSAIRSEEMQNWVDSGLVDYRGHVQEMRDLLHEVHVVCLPSSYGEGIPKILIEAAACGKPIVATDIPGIRDIVKDGSNGFLVNPNDLELLVQRVAGLIGDKKQREQLGLNSRILFENGGFSEENVTARTIDVYQELLTPSDRELLPLKR